MYRVLYIALIIFISTQGTLGRTFRSRDANVRNIIHDCVLTTPANITTRSKCTSTLTCILSDVPPEYTARWSAGASILAFIPTIVGLMSNSVEEIGLIAEDSPALATLLSMSSVTAFSTRFAGSSSGYGVFEHHPAYVEAAHAQIKRLLEVSGIDGRRSTRQWQLYHSGLVLLAEFMLIVLSAMVWYCTWALGNWGVVVFSCPWSMHAAIWVGLRQVVAITDILLRRYYHEVTVIALNRNGQVPIPIEKSMMSLDHVKRFIPFYDQLSQLKQLFLFLYGLISPTPSDSITVILRSPRKNGVSWALKTWSAVLNTGLYTTGTVVLASIVMVPASDAIRVMVMLILSAGFGRIVGSWTLSPSTRGRKNLIVDVPAAQVQALAQRLKQEDAGLTSAPPIV
ncbi:MAG: hypothetical protein M1812_001295 [Candelaria pacifica]|nr:MAG: hypothetical protein M1812_001295 [Candelaria pacifica]